MSDFDELWTRARTAEDKTESIRNLAKILSSKEGRMFILGLEPSDVELCVGFMDHGLAGNELLSTEKSWFLVSLRRLAARHARLPESMIIRDKIHFSSSVQPYISGGFADLKPGHYKDRTVAVKTMRVAATDDLERIRKRFCQQVVLWRVMSHPNILKLVGVLGGFTECRLAMVSEWMTHGNIMQYIRNNATNRLKLLHGVGRGLRFLHGADLAHGNLKGANILMTNDSPPKPCLADFGFVNVVFEPRNAIDNLPNLTLEGSSMTFMAPELFAPSDSGPTTTVLTKEGDIYAFGLVILQVLTGEPPFRNVNPLELNSYVLRGGRPDKPTDAEDIGISDRLWNLMQRCWDNDKTRRPLIKEVTDTIRKVALNWHTDMPPSGTEQLEDLVLREAFDELRRAELSQSSVGEDVPLFDPNADETCPRITLNQESPAPRTALPLRKSKGFEYYLNRIPLTFRRKSRG